MDYNKTIIGHYENCLEQYGANHRGLDWSNDEDVQIRYKIMTDIFNFRNLANNKIAVLDLGCGYGGIIEFLRKHNLEKNVDYHGIDLSQKMIDAAKSRYPGQFFECRDIVKKPLIEYSFDFVIMNGLFTVKRELPQEVMLKFFKQFIKAAFKVCKIGLAFNVMSNHVDWKRDDLFHLSFDQLARFLSKDVSRDFIFRSDYKLYEYTVYLFK
jgi:SAM-dependent methyltransferase